PEKFGPEDSPLGSRERDQDYVVLVLAPAALALDLQDTDDPEGNVLDADVGTDRILAESKEIVDDGPAQDGDGAGGIQVPLREESPRHRRPLAYPLVGRRGPLHHRGPVLVSVDDLNQLTTKIRYTVDARALLLNRDGVAGPQRGDPSRAGADTTRRRGAGQHHEQVLPETSVLC